jgi:hypothetical protein
VISLTPTPEAFASLVLEAARRQEAAELSELARVTRVYRLSLGGRALMHQSRCEHAMAALLAAAAQVAGEVAADLEDRALFLASLASCGGQA